MTKTLNKQFRQEVVLVTGASSGIGTQIARHLANAGHIVFGTSRSQKPDFGDANNLVRMLPLDISDEHSVQSCLNKVEASTTGLTVLINNAGNGIGGAIEDITDAEFRWQMNTNCFGTLNVIRAALPRMRKRNYGKIVTVSSIGGHIGLPFQGAYCASKFALEAVNEALRFELVGSGVQSTVICPGDFKTGFTEARRIADNSASEGYAVQFRKTLAIYENDEINGASPEVIGQLAVKLVNRRKLAPRYLVGRFDQKLAVYLKRFLPAWLFERAVRKAFGIGV